MLIHSERIKQRCLDICAKLRQHIWSGIVNMVDSR